MNQYGLLQPFHWWKDEQHISTSLRPLTMLRRIVIFLWGRKKEEHYTGVIRKQFRANKIKTNEGLCSDPSTFVSLFRCIYFIPKKRDKQTKRKNKLNSLKYIFSITIFSYKIKIVLPVILSINAGFLLLLLLHCDLTIERLVERLSHNCSKTVWALGEFNLFVNCTSQLCIAA